MPKPRFVKGDRVVITILNGRGGTVLRTPKRRHSGPRGYLGGSLICFIFGGQYSYEVDVDGRIPSLQVLAESSLVPAPAKAAA